MKVHDALLAALTSTSLAGCCWGSSVCDCNPDNERFIIDEVLTSEDVDAVLAEWGFTSVEDLDCETFCRAAYQDATDWEASEIDTCSFELPVSTGTGTPLDGSVQCTGTGLEYFCEGRRPLGHVEAPVDAGALGPFLAGLAHLEAASVDAFEELAAQLASLGASDALVTRCLAAADDERAHARWLSVLAGRLGATVAPCASTPHPSSILDIALHNAVEGCVHETWAALVAHVRAARASDGALRATFARIAVDEARHGQLAWDLHAWFLERLDEDGRARVQTAMARALDALPAVAASQASVPAALGQPPAEAARAMAVELGRQLAA